MLLFSGNLYAKETEIDEADNSLKLDKDGIKVYIFRHKTSKFATFKAITHINASLDSILAVMFDNNSYTDWIHACEKSFVIEEINFNERYHYQIISLPFPFINRDFVFHSILTQNPMTKALTITMSSVTNYCGNNSSKQCKKVRESKLVRVKKSIATYKLEVDGSGTKITWIQHTDPSGNLPNWLVNSLIKETPYRTLKNLATKVEEDKYKYAKLFYGEQGIATRLNMSEQIYPDENLPKTNKKSTKDFPIFPTF